MRFLSRSICSSFNGGKARRRQNEIRGAISLVHRLIQRFSFVLLLLEGCVLEILFRPLRDRALVSSLRHPETLDAIAPLRKARIVYPILGGKKEFVVLIHLRTQLVTNWFVDKPFTL